MNSAALDKAYITWYAQIKVLEEEMQTQLTSKWYSLWRSYNCPFSLEKEVINRPTTRHAPSSPVLTRPEGVVYMYSLVTLFWGDLLSGGYDFQRLSHSQLPGRHYITQSLDMRCLEAPSCQRKDHHILWFTLHPIPIKTHYHADYLQTVSHNKHHTERLYQNNWLWGEKRQALYNYI